MITAEVNSIGEGTSTQARPLLFFKAISVLFLLQGEPKNHYRLGL